MVQQRERPDRREDGRCSSDQRRTPHCDSVGVDDNGTASIRCRRLQPVAHYRVPVGMQSRRVNCIRGRRRHGVFEYQVSLRVPGELVGFTPPVPTPAFALAVLTSQPVMSRYISRLGGSLAVETWACRVGPNDFLGKPLRSRRTDEHEPRHPSARADARFQKPEGLRSRFHCGAREAIRNVVRRVSSDARRHRAHALQHRFQVQRCSGVDGLHRLCSPAPSPTALLVRLLPSCL